MTTKNRTCCLRLLGILALFFAFPLFTADRYVDVFVAEGGVDALRRLVADAAANERVKELAADLLGFLRKGE